MPTGKRASMREGPLADLFRKTAEDTGRPTPGAEQERGEQQVPVLPAAAGRAARARGEVRTRPRARPSAAGRAPRALAAGAPAPRVLRRHPRERALARSAPRPSRSQSPTSMPSLSEPATRSLRARPVGTPVLRVVGVGGAGVNARQPDGRGGGRGRRVPRDQHRPAVAAAVRGARDPSHRRLDHARPRLGLGPRARPPGRDARSTTGSSRCCAARTWSSSPPAPAAAPVPAPRRSWLRSPASSAR